MQLLVPVFTGIKTALTGGAAASAGAAATGGGLSLASILQGGATVLGIASAFRAGAAEEDRLNQEAADAEVEQAQETLKGIDRRTQTRKAVLQAVGSLDAAYAAGGVDLSFGTVSQARTEFFREGDTAVGTQGGAELSRVTRLAERASNYRAAAKRAKSAAVLEGITGGLTNFSQIARRGY